jgi:hypothetical protein
MYVSDASRALFWIENYSRQLIDFNQSKNFSYRDCAAMNIQSLLSVLFFKTTISDDQRRIDFS